jgi:hypothetical protein
MKIEGQIEKRQIYNRRRLRARKRTRGRGGREIWQTRKKAKG